MAAFGFLMQIRLSSPVKVMAAGLIHLAELPEFRIIYGAGLHATMEGGHSIPITVGHGFQDITWDRLG